LDKNWHSTRERTSPDAEHKHNAVSSIDPTSPELQGRGTRAYRLHWTRASL